ncbi:hypothetical protein NFI96_004476 [Prochilodus magdalenae]|nr:hypothetical protein NFI96_004476 [Prochilodus magdalenae]
MRGIFPFHLKCRQNATGARFKVERENSKFKPEKMKTFTINRSRESGEIPVHKGQGQRSVYRQDSVLDITAWAQEHFQCFPFGRTPWYRDEILRPLVGPYAGAVGPGLLLMQDNARPHVAGVYQQFLQDEGIEAMDWPARSPDLNPIEHIWDIMSRSIHQRHVAPQTVQELADALVQNDVHQREGIGGRSTVYTSLMTSWPLNLTDSQPHSLTTSQTLNLTASQPHSLTTSQPLNLTDSQPHSFPTSHSLSLTVSQPQSHNLAASQPQSHNLTASQPHILLASQFHNLTDSQPHRLSTSQSHNLTASQPHSLTTSQPLNLTAFQPRSLSTSQPFNLAASQPRSLSTSQPFNLTASQPHSLTTSQPLNLTDSQHYGMVVFYSSATLDLESSFLWLSSKTEKRYIFYSVAFIILSCLGSSADEVMKSHYPSTYGVLCYNTCGKYGEDYYWCKTREGWDYCSPAQNRDYKDNACRDDHPCDKHGESYYWCNRKGWFSGWGYCGPVESKTTVYISSKYQRVCIDDCLYDEYYEYSWCYTDKGWDYCSPTPDVTYKNVPCRSDHSCDSHGYSYSWCWITASEYDYCGVIKACECSSFTTKRYKRHLRNAVALCVRNDTGGQVETTFFAEPNQEALADGSSSRNEITHLISLWENGGLGNQTRSGLFVFRDFRIDLQGLVNRGDHQYYDLQIQQNVPRRHGESTTVSHVLIPRNISVPDRYVRHAFVESFQRRATVTVEVNQRK